MRWIRQANACIAWTPSLGVLAHDGPVLRCCLFGKADKLLTVLSQLGSSTGFITCVTLYNYICIEEDRKGADFHRSKETPEVKVFVLEREYPQMRER